MTQGSVIRACCNAWTHRYKSISYSPRMATLRSPPAALENYDGVTMTGSALNIYNGGEPVTRQIELAKAVFAAGVPFFGSCWGLQVAVTAAGGEVRANPRGREFGFARRILLTDAGSAASFVRGKAGRLRGSQRASR